MAIPDFTADGILPEGIHDCAFAELEARLGQSQYIEDTSGGSRRGTMCYQRQRLCSRLRDYLGELASVGLRVEVIVDGSFATSKQTPNDIDIIVVFPAGVDLTKDLPFNQQQLVTKDGLKYKQYPFDMKKAVSGSSAYREAVAFFYQVRGKPDLKKGLLRLVAS